MNEQIIALYFVKKIQFHIYINIYISLLIYDIQYWDIFILCHMSLQHFLIINLLIFK